MVECNRCILHDGIPGVRIEADGECNYCKLHDRWELDHDPLHGRKWLNRVFQEMRENKTGVYDCIVGVSGGVDSSHILAMAADYGLNPLAVHWNNGWNTKTATENMRKLTDKMGIDFYQVGIEAEEFNDVCRAFLLASTPDADIPNDIALTTVLYQACEIHDCKYLLNGHSFRTEGTTPLGWTYMDGGYIEDVHNRYGSWTMRKFPNLEYDRFKHFIELGIERIRPLWVVPYNKAKVKTELEDRFGWRDYGAHHAENLYTLFVGAYLWPVKFGMDLRYVEYSALIRSGFMTREYASGKILTPPKYPATLPFRVRSRLRMTKDIWEMMMEAPIKTHEDYITYQQRFKDDQEYFEEALKKGLIPETFYRKYVLGVQ
jgi:hypothetical protein